MSTGSGSFTLVCGKTPGAACVPRAHQYSREEQPVRRDRQSGIAFAAWRGRSFTPDRRDGIPQESRRPATQATARLSTLWRRWPAWPARSAAFQSERSPCKHPTQGRTERKVDSGRSKRRARQGMTVEMIKIEKPDPILLHTRARIGHSDPRSVPMICKVSSDPVLLEERLPLAYGIASKIDCPIARPIRTNNLETSKWLRQRGCVVFREDCDDFSRS